MRKSFTAVLAGTAVAAAVATTVVAPASADTGVRDTSAADLYVRADKPTAAQFERQAAAFWNPNISIDQKVAVSVNGAKARPELEKVMAYNKVYDFLGASARTTGPANVNGSKATVGLSAIVVGFPATGYTYYYTREGGLWKFDWKANCASMGCTGNPNFGY
ncbi:hypothetical protein [Tsukamurella spumae]|uniref:Low molecular weight antigen MTB12-like C-terminal domain-containing protein n=1 Tax=Tsukamurella spumae TaxID=44753 RepID=A0A846X5E6_9ACTN|nr:hypothetical protein [Tsukamurella spumae]NKY20728.1 hypothetical protein [Tsukamurella spumae]